MERAENVKIGRSTVRFSSLEDLLIHKMIAGQPRDLEDIKQSFKKNPEYNAEDIVSWLREFGRSLETDYPGQFQPLARSVRSRR